MTSPDRYVAAIDRHGSLCAWNVHDGALVLHVKPESPSAEFRAIAFLGPSRLAAAGIVAAESYLKETPSPISVWNLDSRELQIAGRDDSLSPVATILPLPFAPGLAVTSHSCGRIRVWNIAEGIPCAALRWGDLPPGLQGKKTLDEFELQFRIDLRRESAVIALARLEPAVTAGSSADTADIRHILCGANVKGSLAFWPLTEGAAAAAEGPFDVFPGRCEGLLFDSSQNRCQVTAMADVGPGKLAVAFGDGTLRLIHLPTIVTIARISQSLDPPAHPSVLLLRLGQDCRGICRRAASCIHVLPPPAAISATDPHAAAADVLSADANGQVHRWSLADPSVLLSLVGVSLLRPDQSSQPGACLSAGCPLALLARAERSDEPEGSEGSRGPAQPKRHELWDVVGGGVVASLEAPPPTMAAPPRLSVSSSRINPLLSFRTVACFGPDWYAPAAAAAAAAAAGSLSVAELSLGSRATGPSVPPEGEPDAPPPPAGTLQPLVEKGVFGDVIGPLLGPKERVALRACCRALRDLCRARFPAPPPRLFVNIDAKTNAACVWRLGDGVCIRSFPIHSNGSCWGSPVGDLGEGRFLVPDALLLHIFHARSGRLLGSASVTGDGSHPLPDDQPCVVGCVATLGRPLAIAQGGSEQTVAVALGSELRVLRLRYSADGASVEGSVQCVIPAAYARVLAFVRPGGALTRPLLAASGSYDEIVYLYDPATGERTASLAAEAFQGNENLTLSLADIGRGLLLSADITGFLHIWDAARGVRLCTVEDAAGPDRRGGYAGRLVGYVACACLLRCGAAAAASEFRAGTVGRPAAANDGEDEAWGWEESAERGPSASAPGATSTVGDPQGGLPYEALVATGGGDETLRIWRVRMDASGAVTVAPECPPAVGHASNLRSVKRVDSRGDWLLSCSNDKTARNTFLLAPTTLPKPSLKSLSMLAERRSDHAWSWRERN